MWILYNVTFPDGYYDSKEYKTIVAKFSTKELAQKYVDKSTIKKGDNPWSRHSFLRSSLLYGDSYEIEEEDDVPIDPPISGLIQNKEYLVKVKEKTGREFTVSCRTFATAEKELDDYSSCQYVESAEIEEIVV